MDYETFKWSLLEEVNGRTEAGTIVRLHRIPRENGRRTDAISLAAEGGVMTPAVDLRPWYTSYINGEETLPSIAGRLIAGHSGTVRENRLYGRFPSFEEIADRVFIRLMNAALNEEFIKQLPSIRFLDLAAVFYIRLDLSRYYDAMILINNQDLERWKITSEDLKTTAMRNMIRDKKPAFVPMRQILGETADEEANEEVPVMYVLTNSERWYGASVILYPRLTEKIAEQLKSDFFILPSSVHEMIILPDDIGYSVDKLETLVREVNRQEVRDVDFLSNHVYRYERDGDGLRLAGHDS